jgi:UDP-N-acetylglucosamine--N-acetylmuramyl-(pentapeptide) pyrophosphoryl-undecaprenol N-acetylglucosamine transferase
METRHIVIACGGSGGHLAPGIALAEECSNRGYQPIFFVSSKSVDHKMLAPYPSWPVVVLPADPLLPTLWKFLRFCRSQVASLIKVLRFLSHEPVEAIILTGGFTALPVALAGFFKRIPIFIHESNSIPGKATRWLSVFARRIYVTKNWILEPKNCSFHRKIMVCGYPLRSEFLKGNGQEEVSLRGDPQEGFHLILIGGSQGARVLNEWFWEHSAELQRLAQHITCVTGQTYYEEHKADLDHRSSEHPNIHFLAFCDAMVPLLSKADLVIARAGSGTISECVQCELPMILVPLPSAADNHQQVNAEWIQNLGGAYVVKETELDFLLSLVKWILSSPEILERMRNKIQNQKDTTDARQQIMDDLLASIGKGKGH